jgi:hypothetical protein
MRRKYGRNAHQILRGDAGIPQGQLKGCETFFVLAYSFGEKDALRHHADSQCSCLLQNLFLANEEK